MMTAEQFYDDVYEGDNGCELFPPEVFVEALKFAEAYAAAQLAEKEREILNLKSDAFEADLELTAAEGRIAKLSEEFESQRQARLAAEQRLQEAQAEIAMLTQQRNVRSEQAESYATRLRQREAELEQRWIAIGERLPEYGTCLMVYVYDRKDERKVSWQDLATYSYHGGWSVGSPIEPDLVVTHWQPLPSPPKDSAENVGEGSTS